MKELLFSITEKDFDWEYFPAGGKGGQKQNKTFCACRCSHKESKATAISRDHRQQFQNRKTAFRRVIETDTFKTWFKLECSRRLLSKEQKDKIEREIQKYIDDAMSDENIKYEIKENGKWKEVDKTHFDVK